MSVRDVPGQTPRVETGPVRFGDDWPGLFVRGDDAFALMLDLKLVLHLVAEHDDRTPIRLLRSRLQALHDTIDAGVIDRSEFERTTTDLGEDG